MSREGEVAGAEVREAAATWLLRLADPACSAEERRKFQRWMARSPLHRQEFEAFRRLWGALDHLRPAGRRPGRRTAAALAVAGLLALAGWQAPVALWQRETLVAAVGERKSVTLADGSRVDLDGATALRVAYSPLGRTVVLERGQALFTVAPGYRPFQVEAGVGVLRDIGTTFNVRREVGATEEVSLAVAEGQVEIRLPSGQRAVLAGGQQARYDGAAMTPVQPVAPADVAPWRQGRWVFAEASLAEVAAQVNRRHERPLVVAAELARYRVSGVFNQDDRAGLVLALTRLLPVRAEESAGSTVLRPR